MYKPETGWQTTDDQRMVYNLRHLNEGDQTMVNDVAVTIEARHHSDEIQEEIARVIRNALNGHFQVQVETDEEWAARIGRTLNEHASRNAE